MLWGVPRTFGWVSSSVTTSAVGSTESTSAAWMLSALVVSSIPREPCAVEGSNSTCH